MTNPPFIEDDSVDHTVDVEAINVLIKQIETGFNTNDAEILVRPFIANGSAVNVVGMQLDGYEELLEASQHGLDGPLKDQYAHYELADLLFLRPDVAIGHKHARATTADGRLIDLDHAMVALYVFIKQGGRWWVAARQNTLIPSAPDP